MANYVGILSLAAGLLSFLSVCFGGNIMTTCPHAKTNILSCEHALIERVNSMLAASGKSLSAIDLDNVTESELLDEKTRDVVCSISNMEYVACIIDNGTVCPDLATDGDITSTWIASLIVPHLDVVTSPQRVCEFFQDSVCSYREIKMNRCYNAIVGDVEIENAKVDMCVPDKLHYLTCMLETYTECKPYMNLTDNHNIAENIKTKMVEDIWETFGTGEELCDCYEGSECYMELDRDIKIVNISDASVRGEYRHIVLFAETLCSNVTRIKCALKAQSSSCKNVLPNYNSSSSQISDYNGVVDNICTEVNSIEFENQKVCIVDRLDNSFGPCLEEVNLTILSITECSNLQKLYHCMKSALGGKCNKNFVDTVFLTLKVAAQITLPCDVTSSAISFYTLPHAYFVFLFNIVIYAFLK